MFLLIFFICLLVFMGLLGKVLKVPAKKIDGGKAQMTTSEALKWILGLVISLLLSAWIAEATTKTPHAEHEQTRTARPYV